MQPVIGFVSIPETSYLSCSERENVEMPSSAEIVVRFPYFAMGVEFFLEYRKLAEGAYDTQPARFIQK